MPRIHHLGATLVFATAYGLSCASAMAADSAGAPPPALTDSVIVYRGELTYRGEPVMGPVDIVFTMFADDVGEDRIGEPVLAEQWEVIDGRVAVAFEFDEPHFLEHGAWMEISIDGTVLSPRWHVPAPGLSLATQSARSIASSALLMLLKGLEAEPNGGEADDADASTTSTGSPAMRYAVGASSSVAPAQHNQLHRPAFDGWDDDDDLEYDSEDDEFDGQRSNHNPGWELRGSNIVWTKNKVGINVQNPSARFDVKGASRFRNNVTFNKNIVVQGNINAAGLRVLAQGNDVPNVIGGHSANRAGAGVIGGTIGGGGEANGRNRVLANYATVGGGRNNTATSTVATVGGGGGNTAGNNAASVGGGTGNNASGQWATIAGGFNNTANFMDAAVGGGAGNIASGQAATVPGGRENTAAGVYSFAAGFRAKALHGGSFVLSDSSSNDDFESAQVARFHARFLHGYQLYTNSAASLGVQALNNATSWSALSDRNVKHNFEPIDAIDIAHRLSTIPITRWTYIDDDENVPHMGPMAQDFYEAFGLGELDTHIATLDADGVLFAAVQGVYQLVQEKDADIAQLRDELAATQASNAELKARLERIEASLGWRN